MIVVVGIRSRDLASDGHEMDKILCPSVSNMRSETFIDGNLGVQCVSSAEITPDVRSGW
jgi:hypothetical protein